MLNLANLFIFKLLSVSMHSDLDERLSAEIIKLRGDRKISDIAKRLSIRAHLATSSAHNLIHRIESGEIGSTAIHHAIKKPISQKNLNYIALYLECLSVDPKEQIIQNLKESYRNFNYPLNSSSQKPKRQYTRASG